MKMQCLNCGSGQVTSVIQYGLSQHAVHEGKCEACGYTWLENEAWRPTNPCPSCGRELDGIFQCRQCDAAFEDHLRILQDTLTIMERWRELMRKMHGGHK